MKKKILIADGSTYMRNVLKDILTRNDYDVVGDVANMEDVLKESKILTPEIITLDLTMHGFQGVESIKIFKSQYPMIKIIVVSVLGQQELVIEALKAGATEFLLKPFQTEMVLELFKKITK